MPEVFDDRVSLVERSSRVRRSASRSVRSSAADRLPDAIDELFDALHLLPRRPLGCGLAFVFATFDDSGGSRIALGNRGVEAVGTLAERVPFLHRVLPGLFLETVFRRQPGGFL